MTFLELPFIFFEHSRTLSMDHGRSPKIPREERTHAPTRGRAGQGRAGQVTRGKGREDWLRQRDSARRWARVFGTRDVRFLPLSEDWSGGGGSGVVL